MLGQFTLRALFIASASAWLFAAGPLWAQEEAESTDQSLTALEVYPVTIQLDGARAEAQLVVTGHYGQSSTRDLTRRTTLSIDDAQVARIEDQRILAVGNGETALSVTAAGRQVTVPVRVTRSDRPDPIRFQFETLAVITKQGCNSGSCHGSPQGKGGFSLSLFAYDPEMDHQSLVRGGLNRRVNLLVPAESLLLKKPTLRIAHGGGKQLRKDDVALSILRQWIHEGASVTTPSDTRCNQIIVTPGKPRVVHSPDRWQQLNVTAHFDDGTRRDVTRLATYDTSSEEVAVVDANGLITCHEKGQAAITIRYLSHLESVHITHVTSDDQFVWKKPVELNELDRVVNEKLNLLQYQPSSICSDSVFLRRVYLDLTGLLPGVERARTFLQDPLHDKRSRLVDELLESDQFARFQSLQMADLLHVNPQVLGAHRAQLFADWIAGAIIAERPYDQFAREILTATGDSDTVGPASYFAAIGSTLEVSEATAQIFMGSRIQCAKCHNHPFENWTQNDYYRLAAVFHRVERMATVINISQVGEMKHPKSGKPMKPWGADGLAEPAGASSPDNGDRRVAFATWLTRKDNPFFARVAVNRIWSQLIGQGIVNPIDDFRSSNPPVNVALIDLLAEEFRNSDFDRKHIIRLVCNSATYQRSTETNATNELDDQLFSHARIRRLSAEQLQDAIGMVTGSLPAADEIARIDTKNRVEFERLVPQRKSGQLQWENKQRELLDQLPFWHADWWSLAPYTADDFNTAFDESFPPEESLASRQQNDAEEIAAKAWLIEPGASLGGRQWRLEPSWEHGTLISLSEQSNAAHFAYHRVFANQLTNVTIRVRSNDGVKVWLNGNKVTDLPKKWEQAAELVPGWNHFLLKIVNSTESCEFELALDTSSDKQLVPGHIAVALMTTGQERTAPQVAALETFHLDLDERIRDLRRELRLGKRFDYASQRPYPEQTSFLKAFGQPGRTSPCACDRLDEPNLEQAIHLLNGQDVFDHVQRGVQTYREMTNEEIVESLCLAAFARLPRDEEQREMLDFVSSGDDRDQAIGDLLWAVMATQEFLFQH
jgi:hypothetical protein